MGPRVAAAPAVLMALLATTGCAVFGSQPASKPAAPSSDLGRDETGQIGVNAYLWRAALDTVHFMPLASADPYGGVIITDWYANPQKPDERFKITVYILDTRLRADGVSAQVFRETLANGQWKSAGVANDTNVAIENAILNRARQLRLSAIGG